jgi:hypothetical protein
MSMTNKFTRMKRVVGVGAVGTLLAGGALLSLPSPASAITCDQLQSQYNSMVLHASVLRDLGDHYASLGYSYSYIAEGYFSRERDLWIDINNLQQC